MQKVPDTTPAPPTSEEEVVRPAVERRFSLVRCLLKMTWKTLVILFIFCVGFILGNLCATDEAKRAANSHPLVYVYDTERKVEDLFQTMEKQLSEETGLPFGSPRLKEWMAMIREEGTPLVAVGPFAVFVKKNGDEFSVREIQSNKELKHPLVMLNCSGQSKRLTFASSLEKNAVLPRFYIALNYSEDGTYKKGVFSIHEKDGSLDRTYFDADGIGVFDRMMVSENDDFNMYRLNDLSWVKVDNDVSEAVLEETRRLNKASQELDTFFHKSSPNPETPDSEPDSGETPQGNQAGD